MDELPRRMMQGHRGGSQEVLPTMSRPVASTSAPVLYAQPIADNTMVPKATFGTRSGPGYNEPLPIPDSTGFSGSKSSNWTAIQSKRGDVPELQAKSSGGIQSNPTTTVVVHYAIPQGQRFLPINLDETVTMIAIG